jgi:hypothetical protein
VFRRTKVLTWAPILAVRWKHFDRVILNSRLFVNWAKIFYPKSEIDKKNDGMPDAWIYDGTFRGIYSANLGFGQIESEYNVQYGSSPR